MAGGDTKSHHHHHGKKRQAPAVEPPLSPPPPPTHDLTYGEVSSWTSHICHYLMSKGIKAGSTVGILLNQPNVFYVAMMAVLKAGGEYISFDPQLSDDKIHETFRQSTAPILYFITSPSLESRLPSSSKAVKPAEVILIDVDGDQGSIMAGEHEEEGLLKGGK